MNYSRRQLEALGEPLGTSVTRLKDGGFGRIYGGGGGGGGGGNQTSSTTQTTELPEWARPYAKDVLARGQALTDTSQNPYQTYTQPRIAGFSGLQQQAQTGAAMLAPSAQTGTASNLAAAAGLGALNMPQYQAGRFSGGMFTPGAAQAYMNPYVQASLDPQMALLQRQQGQQAAQMAGQATQAGAFGGSRFGLAQAQQNLNNQLSMQNLVGQGYNTAFQQAQQQFNQDMARRMQAQQLGEQSRQFGANLGLQGLQTGLQAAGTLGNLGQQQFTQQQQTIDTQSKMGAQEQALRQQGLDQAYQDFLNQQNYPYKQLGFMSDLIRGLPLGQQSTAQIYQPGPSGLQTLGALGLGAYGMSKLGGFAEGGSVADKFHDPEAMMADMSKLTDQQLQQILQAPTTPAEAEAAQRELAIRASERRGLAGAFNQVPYDAQERMVRAAGGGILAFQSGGAATNTEPEETPQTDQVVSPGNPGMYQSALQQALDYGKKIGEFQPKGMTTEDYNKAIADRYALMQKLGGESPYAKFEQQLAERETERGRAREEGKGIAALQAIPAILQPGGTIRGLGAAAGSLGGSYAKLAEADAAEKRAIQSLQFNIADAQRKERMGLGREAIGAADQARKDQADINRAHIEKLRAQATIAARVAQAAKPTGQGGGAGKGPKINEQLAAAEVDYENDPSDANLKRVTALRRAVAQTKTTDIGKTKADLTREGQVSQENAKVQAAMNKFKYDPAYLEARQAGPEEADRVWREELARQRQLFGRENPEMAPVNKNSPEAKTTRIKLDAKGNVIP